MSTFPTCEQFEHQPTAPHRRTPYPMLAVRFSPDERARLEAAARVLGMPASTLVRRLVFGIVRPGVTGADEEGGHAHAE